MTDGTRVPSTFRTLIADPPWAFGDSLPGPKRGAKKHYRTMSVDEICDFPIPAMEEHSMLFLWRVSSMVEEAYEVVRQWGFEPKAELVWRKLSATGDKLHFGMGHFTRASHETCIIATRGSPPIRSRSVRSVFDAPVGAHSSKPDAFYEVVEDLTYGPFAELFARRHRKGWTCYGAELPPEKDF